MMVVSTAVTTAEATSVVPSYTTFSLDSSGPALSICRMMFSTSTMAMSTIVPIAMAIPDKATILAVTSMYFMAMKVMSTAMGRTPDIRAEALRFITIISTTMIVIRICSDKASSSVPIVSWISSVLS